MVEGRQVIGKGQSTRQRFLMRKQAVFLAALVVAAVGAVAAYAGFSSQGSGAGTATVGTSTPLTIAQTNAITGLLPGSTAEPVEYSIVNASGNGAQNLGLVTASITSVSGGSNTPSVCTASNFQVTAATVPVGTIADGATFDSTSDTASEPKVQMVETGTNQDGCEGATVHLTLSAAEGS